MSQKHDVEFYIGFAKDRIKSALDHEAAKTGLDLDVLKSEAFIHCRKHAENYDDQYGTSGFTKWFIARLHETATRLVLNKAEYEALLAKKLRGNKDIGFNSDLVVRVEDEVHTNLKLNDKEETKECHDCGLPLPLDQYYKCTANKKDGLSHICKGCTKKRYPGKTSENGEKRTYKRKNIPLSNEVHIHKGTYSLPKSEFAFQDNEIEDMICMLDLRLEAAKKVLESAQANVDYVNNLMNKLKARKRNN